MAECSAFDESISCHVNVYSFERHGQLDSDAFSVLLFGNAPERFGSRTAANTSPLDRDLSVEYCRNNEPTRSSFYTCWGMAWDERNFATYKVNVAEPIESNYSRRWYQANDALLRFLYACMHQLSIWLVFFRVNFYPSVLASMLLCFVSFLR